MADMVCPVCGGQMILVYGCMWDYDRHVCADSKCCGEIERNQSTFPEGGNKQKQEDE